jgi:hypothetical protein
MPLLTSFSFSVVSDHCRTLYWKCQPAEEVPEVVRQGEELQPGVIGPFTRSQPASGL